MRELAIEVGKRLLPPKSDATPGELQTWRWMLAIATLANAFGLTAHIALACGLVTFWPGFASATETQEIRADMHADREAQLESQMLDTRTKQCTTTGRVQVLYTNSLQKMLVEYQKLTDRIYPVPDCRFFSTD